MADYKDFNLDNEKINKASKFTIFFLIDLKAVFIITYVYITVVNLISATANSEATRDAKSMTTFNVTSQFGHQGVEVKFIDNAVLWNCRENSVTKSYYKTLYWMLFGTTLTMLIIFLVVKVAIVWGATHGYTYLWRLAILEYFHEELDLELNPELDSTQTNLKATRDAKCYEMLISVNPKTIEVPKTANILRKVFLKYSLFLLPALLLITGLSYDLHPLSCMAGPVEDFIQYNGSTKTVEIRYSDNLLVFQKIMAFVALYLGGMFAGCVIGFVSCNYYIIAKLKEQAKLVKLEYFYEILEKEAKESQTDQLDITTHKIKNLQQRKELINELIKKKKNEMKKLPQKSQEHWKSSIADLEGKVEYINDQLLTLGVPI